jgi:signal peptidase II
MKRPVFVILLVLLIDQALKFWIKTNMYLGQEFHIAGDWFIIHFTENNGMAFGMEFAGEYGKLFLSLFRIVAVVGIGWYLKQLVKDQAHQLLIISMSLILAGAIGNIIDSTFYGVLFSPSDFRLAEFLPDGGGYATLLHGKVVDMFYFPIFSGFLPEWVPFWGGDYFIFFRPVFNIADASISIGVGLIIAFQSIIFKKDKDKKNSAVEQELIQQAD